MSENLLATWKSNPKSCATTLVVPDGCRDLIMSKEEKHQPQWFITSLFDQAKEISIPENSLMVGFRMKPGVTINEHELLSLIQNNSLELEEVSSLLSEHTYLNKSVEDTLDCLASGIKSVEYAAKELGVSTRTLQRNIIRHTEKSPSYWLQLARVRRTATALLESTSLIELAEIQGYSDQSHMNRDFNRWFNISPSALRNMPSIIQQIKSAGYD